MRNPLSAARNLAALVLMVHLKDAIITLGGDTASFHGVPLGEGIVPLREIVEVLRESAPDAGVFLESLVMEAGSPAETWEREQAAAEHGIRFAREELGL